MNLPDLVRQVIARPTDTQDHTLHRRIRWARVARAVVEDVPGDIVEIGAMTGDSTVLFCEIAEEHGRRVMVVDPWIPRTQNCRGGEHEIFVKRTQRWRESGLLYVLRETSQGDLAVRKLQCGPWAFALVDGLHQYETVLSDVMALSESARVICLDDMNMRPVQRAFQEAARRMPEREAIQRRGPMKKWEGYLA
jgi:hypothetical protein